MASLAIAGIALACLVLLVLLAGLVTWRSFQQGEADARQEAPQVGQAPALLTRKHICATQDQPQAHATGRRRLGRGIRQRRAQTLDDSDGSDEDAPQQQHPVQTKEAKRKAYDERRAQKEAEREAAEAAALAELQRAEQARIAKEEEEAKKWLHLISTEEEGQDAAATQGEGSLLTQFVEYVKQSKMVALDELASEFRLPTSQVIQRIGELEGAGMLTGIMDDRGKYVYISVEEMQAVAGYIKERGRVSIAELASKSAVLIDLEARQVEHVQGGGALELDLSGDEEDAS